jgi:hypothetical protein
VKTYKQIVQETVDAPRSPDERRFLQKHVVKVTDYPVDNPEPKTKMKKRRGDLTDGEDKKVYEEKMTDAEMKKREDIVKGMKKNAADLKKRYGDRWKEVMYATATKQAMESFDLDESFKAGKMKLKDGSSIDISSSDAAVLNDYMKTFSPENQKRVMKDFNQKRYELLLRDAKGTAAAPTKRKSDKDDHDDWRETMKSRIASGEVRRAVLSRRKNESFDLDESFKAGSIKLRDGSSVTLSNEDASALNELYKNLNSDNKNKMQKRLESNEKAFNEVLAFAKEAM